MCQVFTWQLLRKFAVVLRACSYDKHAFIGYHKYYVNK